MLAQALNAHPDVTTGAPVDDAEIDRAESALGVMFPPGLRAYLARVGHLEIGADELFGLGDLPEHRELVHMTKSEREMG